MLDMVRLAPFLMLKLALGTQMGETQLHSYSNAYPKNTTNHDTTPFGCCRGKRDKRPRWCSAFFASLAEFERLRTFTFWISSLAKFRRVTVMVSETFFAIPLSRSISIVSMSCRMDRARRSSFQTTITSPGSGIFESFEEFRTVCLRAGCLL